MIQHWRLKLVSLLARNAAVADGAVTFMQRGVSTVLGLAGSVVLARVLGPQDYGLFAVALSLASLMALAAQNGMPVLLTREIAVARAQGRSDTVRLAVAWSLGWSTCVAGILMAVLVLIRSLLSMPLGVSALSMALIVPAVALSRICAGALTGFRRLALGQLPVMVVQPFVFVAAVVILWTIGSDLDAQAALAVRAGAEWIACGLALILVMAHVPRRDTLHCSGDPRPGWRAALFPLGLVVAANAVNMHADIQMLGLISGTAEVGHYRVAIQIFAVSMSAIHIVAAVTAPRIAASGTAVDAAGVRRRYVLATRITTVLSLLFALVFGLLGPVGLSFVFGEAYRASFVPAFVMVCGVAVAALFGPAVMTLNMLGQESAVARYALICAGMNLVLNAVLIPLTGAFGAGLATAACLIAINALAWRRLAKSGVGLRPDIFAIGGRTPDETKDRPCRASAEAT